MRVTHRLGAILRHRGNCTARAAAWGLLVPFARLRARLRLRGLRQGTTVITVNWNSWDHLAVLVDVVKRRSPEGTELLVVDNGSVATGAPRCSLAGVRWLGLPVNLGHDLALDLGVLHCETEYAVVLDVDAFPIRDGWLEELLVPFSKGAQVSGARLNREYVHPCCWAMRTERFIRRRHSFRSHYRPREPGRDASGDVGEEISAAEAPHLHFLEVTSQRGPGDVGTVFGDVVYHNFYATRFEASEEDTLDGVVAADDSRLAWDEAVRRYVE